MEIYPRFIKNRTVKGSAALYTAPHIDMLNIILPKGSVIHYLPESLGNAGFRLDSLLAANWPTNVRVHFLKELEVIKGKAQKKNTSVSKFLQNYYRVQKGIKRSRNLDKDLLNERDLMAIDYSLLLGMYTYSRTPTYRLDRWYNLAFKTIESMNTVGDTGRPQFIQVQMPHAWATLEEFRTCYKDVSAEKRQVFSDPNMQWLLELMRYCGGTESILESVTANNVCFIITLEGKSIFLPLDILRERGYEDDKLDSKLYAALEKLLVYRTTDDHAGLGIEEESDEDDDSVNALMKTIPSSVSQYITDQMNAGQMTSAEQKRLLTAITDMADLPSLGEVDENGVPTTLIDQANITDEDKAVRSVIVPAPTNDDVIPPSMTASRSTTRHSDYVNNLMQKDIANVLLSMLNGGAIIRNVEIVEETDALETIQILKFKVTLTDGKESTISVIIPEINEDGTYKYKGVRYTVDSQRFDLPIRKTKPDKASITSYAGKIFISRSDLSIHDTTKWLNKNIVRLSREEDPLVQQLVHTTNRLPKVDLPLHYTSLMKGMRSFTANGIDFFFDYFKREAFFGKESVKLAEKGGSVLCGKLGDKLVTMTSGNHIEVLGTDKSFTSIKDVIGGHWTKEPKPTAVFKSLGKSLPVLSYLGYTKGLDKLIKLTKTKVRREDSGQRKSTEPNELLVEFANERLYIDVSKPEHALLWNGFTSIDDELRQLDSTDLNKPNGWEAGLLGLGVAQYHLRDWTLMNNMFLDPMTIDILHDMKEPDVLLELFLRCVELVSNDNSPDESDPKFMRLRGMERIVGMLYSIIYDAMREQQRSGNRKITPISIKPEALVNMLSADTATQTVSEVSPIQALKEQEAVSQAGTGGQSGRTLVKRHRGFHANDVGLMSEQGPDSSKVGVRGHTVPDPKITNLRGLVGDAIDGENPAQLGSTVMAVMPDMNHDDDKRQVLGGNQMSAMIPAVGYSPSVYLTGYESVIGSRVGEFYVFQAKQAGVITRVGKKGMTVTYEDGTEAGYKLGIKHASDSGTYYPHEYVTDMAKGDSFEAGWILAWCSGFFTRDIHSPYNVSMMLGTTATVALLEGNDVLEDGSAMSETFRGELSTRTTSMVSFILDSSQDVNGLVGEDSEVNYGDVLVTISEGIERSLDLSNQALSDLDSLGNRSPKSSAKGVVSKLEVFYMGNPEEMSPTLQSLIEMDNKRRSAEANILKGKKVSRTGEVKKSTYIAGKKLMPGNVIIVLYIDKDLDYGVGDKASISNQLKTIVGRILAGVNRTENGVDIDILFGAQSCNARIVHSFRKQGTIIRTVEHVTDIFLDEYFA